jgi:hypothetical protein
VSKDHDLFASLHGGFAIDDDRARSTGLEPIRRGVVRRRQERSKLQLLRLDPGVCRFANENACFPRQAAARRDPRNTGTRSPRSNCRNNGHVVRDDDRAIGGIARAP